MPMPPGLHHEAVMPAHYFYLHGFASSPRSTKATILGDHLRRQGLTLHCPDFNLPAFRSLTITRMIDQVLGDVARLPPGPVVLFGSSLGAVVALQAADRLAGDAAHPIDRLVLLAPALDFDRDGLRFLGAAGMARWRETGTVDIFHYGEGREVPLDYAFWTDSQRYHTFDLRVDRPILILQGRRDAAVDPHMVERYAAARPNVALRLLDDDHMLTASLPTIWREASRFLGLGEER